MDNINELTPPVVVLPIETAIVGDSKVSVETKISVEPLPGTTHGATSSEIDYKTLHEGLTKTSKFKLWWYEIKLRFKTASNHFFCLMAKRSLRFGMFCMAILVGISTVKGLIPDFILPSFVNYILISGTIGGIVAWASNSLPVSDEYKLAIKEEVTSYGEFLKKVQSEGLFNSTK